MKKELLGFINNYQPALKYALSDQWQIKRAEPTVLTPAEYLEKEHGILAYTSDPTVEFTYKDVEKAFIHGGKNGQFREWLRPEQVELRAAVEESLKRHPVNSEPRLVEAFVNLKPPYENE